MVVVKTTLIVTIVMIVIYVIYYDILFWFKTVVNLEGGMFIREWRKVRQEKVS